MSPGWEAAIGIVCTLAVGWFLSSMLRKEKENDFSLEKRQKYLDLDVQERKHRMELEKANFLIRKHNELKPELEYDEEGELAESIEED